MVATQCSIWRTCSPSCSAVTIRDGLAFPNYFTNFVDGEPLDTEAATYAKAMFEQLDWWATALRKARADAAYPG